MSRLLPSWRAGGRTTPRGLSARGTLRPRLGAFGLRGRIVGAVLVTTVATLAVAALAVLGPLEQELRSNALSGLKQQVGKKELARFKAVDPPALLLSQVPSAPDTRPFQIAQAQQRTLFSLRRSLADKLGVAVSEVDLLGYPDRTGQGYPLTPTPDPDAIDPQEFSDSASAFLSGRPVYTIGTINGIQYARAAVPMTLGSPPARYVLAVRKPIADIPGAVHVVRSAFVFAALAGLALTLVLVIPLSGRLVRRLRDLRQAAVELAQPGPAVTVPTDRARDEVGDLARALAAMQRQIHHQEGARRAFVATASHELRTPLTSLEGMLELLDEDLQEDDPDLHDARALLARARAQSRRLGRLAADLLDLSRIDADVELRSEPVELGELSRAVIAEFDLGAGERGVNVVLDDLRGPVWARGDPGSVARILRILLENAVRVSPRGSTINVAIRNGLQAELTVVDEGPGVDLQERELIFERFQRGRETGGQAGFGLGLAIGRELAERMGGGLVLESGAERGAHFKLSLPAAQAPKADALALAQP